MAIRAEWAGMNFELRQGGVADDGLQNYNTVQP